MRLSSVGSAKIIVEEMQGERFICQSGGGKSGKAYENRKHYSQIPENDDQETEKDGCEGPKEKSQAAGSPRSAERLPNQSSGLSICVRRP